MLTPWGRSDETTLIIRGATWVSTPSHGGFAITEKAAVRLLTPEATALGKRLYGSLFYEEDSLYAVVAYEFPGWVRFLNVKDERTDTEIRAALLPILSRWHPEYLLARGIEPDPAAYARYLEDRETDRERNELCESGEETTMTHSVVSHTERTSRAEEKSE